VFDPVGTRTCNMQFGEQVRIAATSRECIALSGVVVLATPWTEFAAIPPIEWARHGSPRTVVDCWRALPHLAIADGVRYISLGTGVAAAVGSEELKTLSIGS